MRYIIKPITACFLLLIFHLHANSQSPKIIADKIVAVVGNRIILQSEITNSIAASYTESGAIPEGAECSIVDEAIISKVFLLQSDKDSVRIRDDEIEAELDQHIRYWVKKFGSVKALEDIVHKDIYQIKQDSRQAIKEIKEAEAIQRTILGAVHITPNEVQLWFQNFTGQLPFIEAQYEIAQVAIYLNPSQELVKYTISELENYKKQIESKRITFESLVASISRDSVSKRRGGLYEIDRNDKTWDPIFIQTVFKLKAGEISTPFQTKLGCHMIQMVEKDRDRATIRHLLLIPPISENEINAKTNLLDSVKRSIKSGSISLDEASLRLKKKNQAQINFLRGPDGSFNLVLNQLSGDIEDKVKKMSPGDFTEPMVFSEDDRRMGVRVFFLKAKSNSHVLNLKDDYAKISEMALEEKKILALKNWIEKNISAVYILVDNEISKNCVTLHKYYNHKKAF